MPHERTRRSSAARSTPGATPAAAPGEATPNRSSDTVGGVPEPLAVISGTDMTVHTPTAWRRRLGAADTDSFIDLVHPDDRRTAVRVWREATLSNATLRASLRIRDAGGGYRQCAMFATPIPSPVGDESEWVLRIDGLELVDGADAMVEGIDLRDTVMDATTDCIKIVGLDGGVRHMNRPGCKALGVSDDEAARGFGMSWVKLLPEPAQDHAQRALTRATLGENARFAGYSVTPDGESQFWDNILNPILDPSGATTAVLCVSRDVSELRKTEASLRAASEVDALTGVLNRRSFRERLQRLLDEAHRATTTVGLFIVDLDHFKTVNDTLGHPAGDHLLRVTAERLRDAAYGNAIVGRLGGDEFAVAIEGVPDGAGLQKAAQRILEGSTAPVSYAGRALSAGMTMGGAMFPHDAQTDSALMTCADAALNEQKAHGRGRAGIFTPAMLTHAVEAAAQIERAQLALRTGEVTAYYQPLFDLDDDRLVGFEALLRWRTPQGELRLPGEIEEAFKHHELAARLGSAVRAQVLSDLICWRERGLQAVPVSFNVAPIELFSKDFAPGLLDALAERAIAPGMVEVEITEQVLADRGAEVASATLARLRGAGVRIAIDDFGTGYSSLARVLDYPVDTLKIDRSFVARLGAHRSSEAIIDAIVAMSGALDACVVAEGIETHAQLDKVRASGVHRGQGFLLGEPLSAAAAARLLAAIPAAEPVAPVATTG